MKQCVVCKEKTAKYPLVDGGWVCDKCLGHFFTCPKCGRIFRKDDYEKGDAFNTGYCKNCSQNENEMSK